MLDAKKLLSILAILGGSSLLVACTPATETPEVSTEAQVGGDEAVMEKEDSDAMMEENAIEEDETMMEDDKMMDEKTDDAMMEEEK